MLGCAITLALEKRSVFVSSKHGKRNVAILDTVVHADVETLIQLRAWLGSHKVSKSREHTASIARYIKGTTGEVWIETS